MSALEKEKQELIQKLKVLDAKECTQRQEDEKIKNYENFLKRKADPIVGRAHLEVDSPSKNIASVTVNGNCSKTYIVDKLNYTNATSTYFHNVWSYEQRNKFQEKLNAFVRQEISEIISHPQQVIELMGLQNNPHLESLYPTSKIKEIKESIKKEQWMILDKYSDDELTSIRFDLSHGCSILSEYLTNNRKHLLKTSRKKD